jgi:hypothetical protein
MGDPNGNWSDLEWTARKLYEHGASLIPLDGKGMPLVDWKRSMESDVSKLPLDTLIEWVRDGAEGLALVLSSSFNGDLWCRTFNHRRDYIAAVTRMGELAVPLACCIKEGSKYNVLFLMGKFKDEGRFEETASGRYAIEYPAGEIRGGYNLVRIPPGDGLQWVQEPVIKLSKSNQSNLHYYDPVLTGFITPF